ncbi:MAG TPA: YSC84-related protein [Usitatibacter sp.]|jgi:lipid-binding SYLF domain-containing protein|nr:YSC84-related protein [Usitatibacter sp.]
MRIRSAAAALACAAAFAAGAAFAASTTDKQAELQKAADATLMKFYKSKPALEKEVKASPGYAVFTTYGLTFLIGGSGGGGVAKNAAGKPTYMSMGQVSAGPKIGVGSTEMLMVFKTPKAYQDFVDNGWEFGGGGAASAGAGKHKAGEGEGEKFVNDARVYTYTKNGVEFGGEFAGTKFWKDKELN